MLNSLGAASNSPPTHYMERKEITPKIVMVNGDVKSDWLPATWELWFENVMPKFKGDEYCSLANHYTPRPYRNEYDRGSNTEGFVYTVQPGSRVCVWERSVK